jgi:hypothetical protein
MQCTVPPGDFHRFEALEDTQALEIYWVDLKENDIVREDHGGLKINETQTDLCDESKRKNYYDTGVVLLGTRPAVIKSCSHPDCGIYCNERAVYLS